jgi:hypothetical protein
VHLKLDPEPGARKGPDFTFLAEGVMKLTSSSDYSLRVPMYLCAAPDRLLTIQDIARAYGISENTSCLQICAP